MRRTGSDWGGNILAFAVMIALNAMATSIPLGGKTPPEISAQYPSLFTPAGFTFSIWAAIYLGLLCFVVYQALPTQRNDARLARIDALFKFNCLANAAWLLAWHYDYLVMSLLIMAAILLSLLAIYRRLDTPGDAATLLVRLPFSLYTAWICVAAIANLSILQTAFGWDDVGMGAVHWTMLKLALAGAIGVSMVTRKRDAAFALVISWAAYGISVKQGATPAVAGAAFTVMLLTLLLVILELARRLRSYIS